MRDGWSSPTCASSLSMISAVTQRLGQGAASRTGQVPRTSRSAMVLSTSSEGPLYRTEKFPGLATQAFRELEERQK